MDPAKISHEKLQDLPHSSKFLITLKSLGMRTPDGGYLCAECKTIFDFVDFLCHQLKSHKNDWMFLCKICNATFHSLQVVSEHTAHHSANNIEIFTRNFPDFSWDDGKAVVDVKEEDFDDDTPLKFYQNSIPVEVQVQESDCNMPYASDTSEEHAILKKKKSPKSLDCLKRGKHFKVKEKLLHHEETCKEIECPRCGQVLKNYNVAKSHYSGVHGSTLTKCAICMSAVDTNVLNDHYENLHPDKIVQCDFCKQFFPSRPLLQRHIIQTHLGFKKRTKKSKDQEVLCTFCGCVCKNAVVFRRHLVKHTNDAIHPCEKCDMQFKSSEDLTSHLRQDHEGKKTRMMCTICLLPCKSAKLLKGHYEKCHAEMTILKCPTCDEAFLQKHKLKSHQEKYKGKCLCVCDICQKKFTRGNFKRHVLSHQKCFQCSMCPRTFTQKAGLKYHINLHTGNRPYKCSKCERSFHSWLARKTHEETHFKVLAKKERTCPCTVCKALFQSRYELGQHLLDAHGIDVYADGTAGTEFEKPIVSPSTGMYECPQCDYKSEKKVNFYAHRYVHRKNRPRHQCEICGKSFLMKDNLKAHLNQHAGMKYPCSACGKTFTTKKNLWQHSHKYCAAMRKFLENK